LREVIPPIERDVTWGRYRTLEKKLPTLAWLKTQNTYSPEMTLTVDVAEVVQERFAYPARPLRLAMADTEVRAVTG
jgi:hypothetical protein